MQYKEDKVLKQPLHGEHYAKLYQSYAPALFAYAYQQTAAREDAEDIVLTVFVSVLQNPQFPTFDEQKQAAWLWTITRNKVVDHFRSNRRQQQVSIEWLEEPLYADERAGPEQVSLTHEERRELVNMVRNLPEIQRTILHLRFGHGLNSDEIGVICDKSASTVRVILSRTLRILRKIYKEREDRSR